jgi:hypothetical protein
VPAEPVDLDHVLTRDDPSHFDELVEPQAVADVDSVDSVETVPSGPEESVESTDVAVPAPAPAPAPASAAVAAEDAAVENVALEDAEDVADVADVAALAAEVPDAVAADCELEGSSVLSASAVAVLDPVTAEPHTEVPSEEAAPAAPTAKPIVVIDTAPSAPSATSAPSGEPALVDAVEDDDDGDDTPTHIDPLLRSQVE